MAKTPLTVETLRHEEATRKNAPTAELATFVSDEDRAAIRVPFERRDPGLDPQLVWRGKDALNWSDLMVEAPPLYIQEKIHPRAVIADLERASARADEADGEGDDAPDLFADFNGVDPDARTEFYAHDQNWSNRMILGDALKAMASLAEREGMKGKVQCIYIDPPYGIKFNSNFQWSTTSRDVKDGKADHLTREPEQVKAFRDTWADGIHSYLTYLRDRLTVARDLLTESGSVFVQIGDENVHRVRALMDEVFGEENSIVTIKFEKTSSLGGQFLDDTADYIVWFAKNRDTAKFRRLFKKRELGEAGASQYTNFMNKDGSYRSYHSGDDVERVFAHGDMRSQSKSETTDFAFQFRGETVPRPKKGGWKTNLQGMNRLMRADRIILMGSTPRYVRYFRDFGAFPISSYWADTSVSGYGDPKTYVVQTLASVVERCILMTTDPGDLVLDPTCGSGTTAYVAEQWGRRWITIDTSRVALALARARIMGARYPWYLLADSREGQVKEGEITRLPPRDTPTRGRIRQGFVYDRESRIMLRDITKNAEIDTIWEEYQEKLEPLRAEINAMRGRDGSDPDLPPFEEWTMPREPGAPWPDAAIKPWENTQKDSARATREKWLA
ncbi:MAG: site-specific DNA-methyltransferase, partial [Pacificimonas sp.]|nr:site-specific DNA-methyltransferase [Pacificimonas sp.]